MRNKHRLNRSTPRNAFKAHWPNFYIKVFVSVWVILLTQIVFTAMAEQERIPLPASIVLNKTGALVEKNRISEAIEVLTSFQGKGHDHYLVRFTLGNYYMLAEKFNSANTIYRQITLDSPDYIPAWYNLAKSYFELKQYRKAAETFVETYDRSAEKKPEILYYASSAYMAGDAPQKALETFNRLSTRHKEHIKLEWKRIWVHILLANKKPLDALPVMEELANQTEGKEQKQWQEMLLYHYLSLEMNDRALLYVTKLTRIDPFEPKWWKGLAHINLIQGFNKDALVALTVYGHLTELSIEEKKLMADLSLSLEVPVQSVEILKRILAETWDSGIVEKLSQSYSALNRPDKALEWVEKGLQKDGTNIDLLMLKGNILYELKDYANAANVFKTLVKHDNTQGNAWLMLGYAAWNADDTKTAHEALKKAHTFSDQKKSAEEALRGLENFKKTIIKNSE